MPKFGVNAQAIYVYDGPEIEAESEDAARAIVKAMLRDCGRGDVVFSGHTEIEVWPVVDGVP